MNQPKKGFIPVMLTPFDESGSIDFDGLTQLTELYIEAGASGLFANCLSSEMFELSTQERLQTIRHIVEVSNGALPVVATGSFGKSLDQQADFIKKVEKTIDTHHFIRTNRSLYKMIKASKKNLIKTSSYTSIYKLFYFFAQKNLECITQTTNFAPRKTTRTLFLTVFLPDG